MEKKRKKSSISPTHLTRTRYPKMVNQLLRAARKARGWTQRDAARELDVCVRTVMRWESGESHPSPYYVGELISLYHKTSDELGLAVWSIQDQDATLMRLVDVDCFRQRALQCAERRAKRAEQQVALLKAELARYNTYPGIGGIGRGPLKYSS